MKTIIPLYAPPNSGEWQKLFRALSEPGAAAKATVIINPAGGPGPKGKWPERQHWLGLMARLGSMGVRLALYVSAQAAEPNGRRVTLTRRDAVELRMDVALWRELYLKHLADSLKIAWWIDHHPCSMEGLDWAEMHELYAALIGEDVIANLRAVPTPAFARACAAQTLCIHDHNHWPPMTQPSVGGKKTALLVAETPGLIPGAKHQAEYLYATPVGHSGGVWQTVSPILERILKLNVA